MAKAIDLKTNPKMVALRDLLVARGSSAYYRYAGEGDEGNVPGGQLD